MKYVIIKIYLIMFNIQNKKLIAHKKPKGKK
jgi:hypothetical protein